MNHSGKHSRLSGSIMKVMGILTGVQMVQVICSMVKMKLVSLWLDTTGIGLFGIFSNAVDTVSSLTDSGVRQTAVRTVSTESNDPGALSRAVATVRGWSAVIAIAGALLMSALSPLLSRIVFGDTKLWWSFALLSFTMLCNSIASGEMAVNQGTRRFRYIARISMFSSVTGLLLSIPMFRFMGDASVIPSILVWSGATLCYALWFRYRAPRKVKVTKTLLREGSSLVRLGGYMAMALFMTNLAQMLFLAWLNRTASTSEVGLYNAGQILCVRYVGFVIAAVGMEFYPRLSAHIRSRERVEVFVSHEISLVLRVLVPLVLCFLIFRHFIVWVLYKSDFEVIIPFISICIGHTVLRAASTCIAYTVVARGDGRLFLLTESADAFVGLGLCIAGYSLWGLEGIGAAYVVWFASYLTMSWLIFRFHYGYRLRPGAVASIASAVATIGCAIAAVMLLPAVVSACLLSIPAIFCLLRLKRI